jgi:uncharacterized protein (TIGR00251 family)
MSADDLQLTIHVVTRAYKSEIVRLEDGTLKVRITAPPVDGAANAELIKVLAKTFAVSKSSVTIVSGETSKTKRVRIIGASKSAIQAVLKA